MSAFILSISDYQMGCLKEHCLFSSKFVYFKLLKDYNHPYYFALNITGPDPDILPLWGGTNFGEGSRGPPRPLWVQGKALVGGTGGRPSLSKMIFSKMILNAFGELSELLYHVSCIFFHL